VAQTKLTSKKKPAKKVVQKAVKKMAKLVSSEDRAAEVRRMAEILKILKREYSEAKCSLDYKNPFELMVATILSAQCTDERVNKTVPALFAKFPTPEAMAGAKLKEIEKLIQSCGFYKNKALSLQKSSSDIVKLHGGQVPGNLDDLIKLRGVGRKTANVILGNAFDIPGLVVDTHVGRLCRRMGFTDATDPEKVETQMMEVVPRTDWTLFSHLLIYHGRAICTARKALCEECPIARFCPKIGVA
jgi:endonuclease-3